VLAVIRAKGSVLQTTKWTHPIGEPIRVSLIQGNITEDEKYNAVMTLGKKNGMYQKKTFIAFRRIFALATRVRFYSK
jgi:apolipoprotein N-acyltransferase